jgi:hypothetical protein
MSHLNPIATITLPQRVATGSWYPIETTVPFLPGVYEVDAVLVTKTAWVSRYAYFDGRGWKPAATTPAEADVLKFCDSYDQQLPITKFRGLTQEV